MDSRTSRFLEHVIARAKQEVRNLYQMEDQDPPGLEGATERGKEVAETYLKKAMLGQMKLSKDQVAALRENLRQRPRYVVNQEAAKKYEEIVQTLIQNAIRKGEIPPAERDTFIEDMQHKILKQ